jgi:hypothetical protein
MIRLLYSVFCFASIIAIVFAIQSCRKDEQTRPIDPTIEKYFGDWKFTKTEYRHSYDYMADSTGSSVLIHTLEIVVNWERTGRVSMGSQGKELYIQWNASSENGYYAYVKDETGNLSCNADCENIPYSLGESPGPYAQHQITDSTFNINLGHSIGSGNPSSNWYIEGVKM